MSSPIRPQLVDGLLEAYVDWREECLGLGRAYERWSSGPAADRDLAFAAYERHSIASSRRARSTPIAPRGSSARASRSSTVWAAGGGRDAARRKAGRSMPDATSIAPNREHRTAINQRAQMIGVSEVRASRLWQVLTGLEPRPSSNRDVKSMTMHGEVAPGSMFRLRVGPGPISSTIQPGAAPRVIGWTGRTLGIRAIHVWHLEARDANARVRTEESLDGLSRGGQSPISWVVSRSARVCSGEMDVDEPVAHHRRKRTP
jgi:hypothetical protein